MDPQNSDAAAAVLSIFAGGVLLYYIIFWGLIIFGLRWIYRFITRPSKKQQREQMFLQKRMERLQYMALSPETRAELELQQKADDAAYTKRQRLILLVAAIVVIAVAIISHLPAHATSASPAITCEVQIPTTKSWDYHSGFGNGDEGELIVRTLPNKNARIVIQVDNGDTAVIVDKQKQWAFVEVFDAPPEQLQGSKFIGEGWVWFPYLTSCRSD